jgi:hypothetical protein
MEPTVIKLIEIVTQYILGPVIKLWFTQKMKDRPRE